MKKLNEILQDSAASVALKKQNQKDKIIAFLLENEGLLKDLSAMDLDTLEALEEYVKGLL